MAYKRLTIQQSQYIRNKFLKELDHLSVSKNGYWYPLCKISKEVKSISFLRDDLNYENWEHLYRTLQSENIKNIYEIKECVEIVRICKVDEYFFESDKQGYDMLFMSESYWFDELRKCLIYTSHEGTISFTGQKIVEKIQANYNLKSIVKDIYFQKRTEE